MQPIRAIAELPFRRRGVLELLNLREHREVPDPDYAGFGFARIERIHLASQGEPEPVVVNDALVVAVHSTEHPENLADDVELEFVIPEVAADYSVTVLLSAFLRTWLPLVSGGERAIVIVVCNPHQATIAQPAAVGGTPVYYPLGDVESWLDDDDGHQTIRLVAQAWRTTEGDG